MALSPSRKSPSPETLRIIRLNAACKGATWWMIFLGLLYVLVGDRSSVWFGLRYMTASAPLLNALGLCYLLLGIYLRRSLNEPENQYMAVDLLTLFFWFQVINVTTTRMSGHPIFGGEWLIAAVNLAFGVALILLRTKSSKMAEGAIEAKDVRLASRETILRLKELLAEKKRVNPIPLDFNSPKPPEPRLPDDPSRKAISEAAPHMD